MKQHPLLMTGSVLVAAWMTTGFAMAQSSGTIHPSPNSSQGASKSERTGESNVPLPKGSPQSGTVDMGKSGSVDSGSNASGSHMESSSSSAMSHRGSENIRDAQQALKDKGYDPGPVDGVMGARTKQAIKNFQNASNIQATGTLNAETADKLGVQSSASSSSSSGSMRSRDNMKSSDTTVGKDTDQPNQSPSKNR